MCIQPDLKLVLVGISGILLLSLSIGSHIEIADSQVEELSGSNATCTGNETVTAIPENQTAQAQIPTEVTENQTEALSNLTVADFGLVMEDL